MRRIGDRLVEAGLFGRAELIAHLLGRDPVYSVRFGSLIGWLWSVRYAATFSSSSVANY